MDKVIINSELRESGGTIQQGTIQLDDWVQGKYRILQFICLNGFYNITKFNNIVYWDEYAGGINLTSQQVTIDVGYYSASELLATLLNLMNAISTLVAITAFLVYYYQIQINLQYHQ